MRIKTDLEGRVLNGKGEIAAVVHQYDRKPRFVRYVLSKYSQGMSEAYIARSYRKISISARIKNFFERVVRFLTKKHENGFLNDVIYEIKRRTTKTPPR